MVFKISVSRRIERVSARVEAVLGWAPSEMVGKPTADFNHPEDWARAGEMLAPLVQAGGGNFVLDTRWRHKQGHWVWIEASVFISPDRQTFYSIAKDITLRRRELDELKTMHQHISSIFNTVADPIFVKDRAHRWIFGNEAFARLLNMPAENYLGKSDYDLFPREMADHFWKKDDEVFASEKVDETEEKILSEVGERTVVTKKSVFRDDSGAPLLVGVIRDITEQKKSLERLRQMQALVERSNMVFGIADLTRKPLFLSAYAVDVFGWKSDRSSILEYCTEKTQKILMEEAVPKVLRGEVWEGKTELINFKTGETIPFLQRVFGVRDDKSNLEFFGTVATDLRDVRRSEATLVHASKMASLGEMASGIAHEINNPLAIMLGKLSQVKRRLPSVAPELAPLLEELDRIEANGKRIARIIKGLRTFSRNADGDPFVITPLSSILEDCIELSRDRFKRNNTELVLPKALTVALECRPTQLSQVVLNLISNAFDALGDAPASWIRIEVQESPGRVLLSVTDSGPGIPDAVAARLMQPFFTTKEVGKGTGLGLSISKGIIEAHHGKFYLDRSAANTRFVIELPLRQSNAEPLAQAA